MNDREKEKESKTGSDKFRYYKLTVKQAGNLILRGHGNEHFRVTLYDADHTKISVRPMRQVLTLSIDSMIRI